MTGAKDPRYLFLFEKCLLVTKKREAEGNVAFVFKSLVQVTIESYSGNYRVLFR